MASLSKELIIALKLNPEPAYKLAQRAGLNPNTLSKLVNGIDTVRPGDRRVLAIGRILGIPESDCFESRETPGDLNVGTARLQG